MRSTFRHPIKKILTSVIALSIICLSIFFCDHPVLAEDSKIESKIINLESKIAKSYSGKFCNAIGIGVSKEGATNLAINENKEARFNPALWFDLVGSRKENLNKINNSRLNNFIIESIVNNCGYAIGLSEKEEIEAFKTYFISKKDAVE